MELDFQLGEVRSVDMNLRTITIVSHVDSKEYTFPLDMPRYSQAVPIPGQQILVAKLFDYDMRHVATFGDIPRTEQRKRPLNSGDHMIESSGGAHMWVDSGGNAQLSDGRAGNFIQMLVGTKMTIKGTNIEITVPGVGDVTIDPDKQEIRVSKTTAGVETAAISITDSNVEISATQRITIGRSIVPGETPAPIGGAVLSFSGIPGEYSIDSLGRPVPGSSVVKITP